MGYNESKATVQRMEDFLERMWQEKEDIEWGHSRPERLAYRIREAIHAAGHHEEYEDYASLIHMYTIRVKEGVVVAEYIGDWAEKRPVEKKGEKKKRRPVESIEKEMQIPEANSLQAVVGAGIRYPSTTEIYFPNAVLMIQELEKLHAWASTKDWKIISHGEKGVTLTKREISEDLVWTPE